MNFLLDTHDGDCEASIDKVIKNGKHVLKREVSCLFDLAVRTPADCGTALLRLSYIPQLD